MQKEELCRELQLDESTADKVLALIAGEVAPSEIEAVVDRNRFSFANLGEDDESILFALDVLIEGFGVECIFEPSDEYNEDFERKPVARFIQTGDMYSPTIVLDDTGRYVLATQGDYTEGA